MRISLICTTKNEEKTIHELVDSMLYQSYAPDEIIFVDGGSTDKTVEILEGYKRDHEIIVLRSRGNIAQGRNFAIKNAGNDIIAVTDAGCILDREWLKNLAKRLDREIDVVSGVFLPYSESLFEFCEGEIVCKDVKKLNAGTFLPSSRSILFRKKAWEEIGGYPENLYTGEDTAFCLRLKDAGFRFSIARDAIVYWRMRKDLKSFFKQFYLYGVGDARSGNIFKMKINFLFFLGSLFYLILLVYSIFLNVILFFLLIGLIFVYLSMTGIQLFIKTKKIKAFYYGVLLLFAKRAGYLLGVSHGMISRSQKRTAYNN